MRHLILTLESPMLAFGGETIDNYGVIRAFPAVSMLTGLFANSLGLRRIEFEAHQSLQDRIIFAARIDREPAGGVSLQDFQTAQLAKNDKGWTTRGAPEGRRGGSPTYNSPALRYRDYFADMRVTVALRLMPADESPTLGDLAEALIQPARPLFIGRKPCLPSAQLFAGFCEGDTAFDALLATPLEDANLAADNVRMLWPHRDGREDISPNRTYMLTDQRNWSSSGLHGGGRWVCEGSVERSRFSVPDNAEAQ